MGLAFFWISSLVSVSPHSIYSISPLSACLQRFPVCFYYVLFILSFFDISLGYFKQKSCFCGFFLSCFPFTCFHLCFHIRCWPNTINPKTTQIYSLSSLSIDFVCVFVCLYLCVCVLRMCLLSREILRLFSQLLQIRTLHS